MEHNNGCKDPFCVQIKLNFPAHSPEFRHCGNFCKFFFNVRSETYYHKKECFRVKEKGESKAFKLIGTQKECDMTNYQIIEANTIKTGESVSNLTTMADQI